MSFGQINHISFSAATAEVIEKGHAQCVEDYLESNHEGDDIPDCALINFTPNADGTHIDFRIFWKTSKKPFTQVEVLEMKKHRMDTEPLSTFMARV